MWGLLYTCSARFGSSIVAVLGSFQVLWGTPVELHWGTCSSKVEVGPPLEFFFVCFVLFCFVFYGSSLVAPL